MRADRWTDGRAGITKLTVAFRDFTDERNNGCYMFWPLLRAIIKQKNRVHKTVGMNAAKFLALASSQVIEISLYIL